jgi:hypothetical protein
VVSFTLQPLYPRGKSPQYPLDRRLGGPQTWSGQRGEEKILPLLGLKLRSLGRPTRSQSLYRLRYPGSNNNNNNNNNNLVITLMENHTEVLQNKAQRKILGSKIGTLEGGENSMMKSRIINIL